MARRTYQILLINYDSSFDQCPHVTPLIDQCAVALSQSLINSGINLRNYQAAKCSWRTGLSRIFDYHLGKLWRWVFLIWKVFRIRSGKVELYCSQISLDINVEGHIDMRYGSACPSVVTIGGQSLFGLGVGKRGGHLAAIVADEAAKTSCKKLFTGGLFSK